ncbi:hypothetical protein C0Q70_13871 [Pomacea canaliculata]|uniref:AMP-dependent synthetase/ligase domain-containing protein n=1 Tax=Pomacea canaliculata TaxID=400727 RepID=A0A2T7NYF7_POMCA|nr:hypothetical protein C0Q70_13871 [Pomacea canaliculata]
MQQATACLMARLVSKEQQMLRHFRQLFDQKALLQNLNCQSKCQPQISLQKTHLRCLSTDIKRVSPANILSPVPDINIPNVSFAEFMFSKWDEFKDDLAVVDYPTKRQYTYRQLKEYSIKVASALYKQGYRSGDVIASFTINLPEFTILFAAASALGVAISPVNPSYTASELSRQLCHSHAKGVFTIPQLLPVVTDAIRDCNLPHDVKVYTFGHAVDGAQFFGSLMEDDGKDFPENVDIDPAKHVLTLPYSSGTTGLPKGVMLSHRNIISNLLQIGTLMDVVRGDRTVGLLPFFHIYGMVVVQFASLMAGSQMITVPRFEPELFLNVLEKEKITYINIVPPIVVFLAKHPLVSKFNLSTLRWLISGAAPLGEDLTKECQERIGCPIYQGYGLTETSPVLNFDRAPGHPGTIGWLVPNTIAKLVDVETGKPVEIGQLGEYCIKGPQQMLGYLNNQEATDDMVDKDGWLHTGDLGYLREDGMVVIEDRLKELIKYKGFQVPPAELEGLLLTHPAVQDAAVIGVPDSEAGELPRAYVVLKHNASAEAEDIIKFVEGM